MAFHPSHHGFIFQSQHEEDQPNLPTISLNTCPPPQHFHGGAGGAIVPNFMMRGSMSFSGGMENINNSNNKCYQEEDDLSDEGSLIGEMKKKRLNLEQVKALEKSFELGNKLEPDRKMQLAKALGLQPRQIAIWFQNRRARGKTKHLEKNYEALKKQFEALKADNDLLHSQNKKLQAELLALRGGGDININDGGGGGGIINNKKDSNNNEGNSWSNGSENSSDLNLDISTAPVVNSPVSHGGAKKSLLLSSSSSSVISKPTPTGSSFSHFLQLQASSHHHSLKMDQMVQDESSFCNIFNGTDDQQHHFWHWPDQQHNFH